MVTPKKHRCSEKESEIVAVKFVTVDGIRRCKIHTSTDLVLLTQSASHKFIVVQKIVTVKKIVTPKNCCSKKESSPSQVVAV